MEDPKRSTYIGSPDNPRTVAFVCYITFIGWLIAYFLLYPGNKTALAAFHLRQSLLFQILAFLVAALFSFTFTMQALWPVAAVLYLVIFIYWFLGFWDAVNGRKRLWPVLSPLAQRLFRSL